MPKEQINYPTVHEAPDGSIPLGPEISLHWSSGGPAYAQLAFGFDVKSMRDYLDQLAKDSPTDSRAIFYTEELRRPELQTMIRAAKRARDAVYGADE